MGDPERADRPAFGDPSPRASHPYRLTLAVAGTIGKGIFGFRTQVTGRANLPRRPDGGIAGGWIAAGLPHRDRWIRSWSPTACRSSHA